jgi:hypothetical protein
MYFVMAALSSSDRERNALRSIVARCECAAKNRTGVTVAQSVAATENLAADMLVSGFGSEMGIDDVLCCRCELYGIFDILNL